MLAGDSASMLSCLARKFAYVKQTFQERLEQAMTAAAIDADALRAHLRSTKGTIGISTQGMRAILNGETKSMTAENAARAARVLGVDFYWLCTGEGSMRDERLPVTKDEDLLDSIGMLLARIPREQREAAAAAMDGWVKSGGTGPWGLMFQAALYPSGKRFGTGG